MRVPPPKEKKEKDGGEGATPAAPGEGKRQPEKEAVPMIAVEAKSWEVGAGLGRLARAVPLLLDCWC